MLEEALYYGKFLFAFVPLAFIPIMIFLERKGAAIIQDRVGPNRAALHIPGVGQFRLFGMVHNATDTIKLFTKESFIPAQAHRVFYLAGPAIPVIIALLLPAFIPWFGPVTFAVARDGGMEIARVSGQILEADGGILALFALSSLTIYGIVLGSWGSNSKYSLLGGMRASAMMVSYEVSMGLGVLGMFLLVGSFSLTEIVEWQSAHAWGIVVQPVGFLLFLASQFAETNRTPFDVAEGDSEIVGGFHTEFSAIRFALYFMGEYAHIAIASILVSTVFLGGYHLPFLGTEEIKAHLGWVLAGVLSAIALLLGLIYRGVGRQKRGYAKLVASDAAIRRREYAIFQGLVGLLALALVAGAVASAIFLHPVPASVGGEFVYPAWVSLVVALVQFGILIAKTLFFCWLFVWVRWTVPRMRYDQVMDLGWKVMLNAALINLIVTAAVVQLLKG